MKKSHYLIIGLFLFIYLTGVFGQGIAYFLNERVYAQFWPIHYLTVLTFFGICLNAAVTGIVLMLKLRKKITDEVTVPLTLLLMTFGVPVHLWSLFVTVMWWG